MDGTRTPGSGHPSPTPSPDRASHPSHATPPTYGLVLSRKRRLQSGEVTLADTLVAANPGIPVGGTQLTVTLHRSAPQHLSWRPPGSDRVRSQLVEPGSVHVGTIGEPWWAQWSKPTSMLIIAVAPKFVASVSADLPLRDIALATQIGIHDRALRLFAKLLEQELAEDGANGRLYVESLAQALVIYLSQRHGAPPIRLPKRGGLAPHRLRRVIDYIQAHIADEVALSDLAQVAQLNLHHFAHAFREAAGVPPYQFLLERRVAKARELLADRQQSIADISFALGFASQSHFTLQFRRFTGTTPARYRRHL